MRKQGSERIAEIVRTATEVIGERGYFGATIQEIADRVGLSQAGVLKHVTNKRNLLDLVLAQFDIDLDKDEYLSTMLGQSEEELARNPPLMPQWYRSIARMNADDPFLTKAYLTLRAEALDSSHPAHDYFARRGSLLRKTVEQVPWKLPAEYSTPEQVGILSMTIGSAMEGLEFRWLGEPGIDLLQYWSKYEDILFPLPHWEGCR